MRLTPFKDSALRAMTRGPLDRTPDGWISRAGVEGIWNTHSILWMSLRGLCSMNHGRTTAAITHAGRREVGADEDWAA